MDENNEHAPIIIKKVKGGHGGHHGGAWKVAFADFMTAMMAFFLVMWLVGQKPEVRQSVAGYFRDPGKFDQRAQQGVLQGGGSVIPSQGLPVGVTKDQENAGSAPNSSDKIRLKNAGEKIVEELEKQQAFSKLKKNVRIQLTSEGLRIILNESEDSPAFFEPGSARLLQQSAVILMIIAKELGNLQNRLVIEGHTDAGYTGRPDYTNWELSADRANTARQLMEASGLWEDQVREVRGFADQFPMIEGNPGDGRNRRVSLVVLYESRERMYDQVEVGEEIMSKIGG